MGFEKFEVEISPSRPVYFSGQAVRGFVKAVVSSEIVCRKISVVMTGKARVRWSERHGKTTHYYSSKEKYMKIIQEMWNGEEFGNRLAAGTYSFPFGIVLPNDLPSSFESGTGRVRYELCAEADRPMFNKTTSTIVFSVNCTYDLNTDPVANRPLFQDKDKTVCCLCCAMGPIHLELSAVRRGYVPGENIVVDGVVVNNSRSNIKYSEAKLIQRIRYITTSKTRTESRTVQRVYRPQIGPGQKDDWLAVPLPIPPVPSSHLQHCNIIEIDYYIELMAKIGSCKTAKMDVPIVIGSIPLRSTLPHFIADNPAVEIGGTMLPTSLDSSPFIAESRRASAIVQPYVDDPTRDDPPPYSPQFLPPEYRDVPPPSYAACMFSNGNVPTSNGTATAPQAENSDSDNDEGGFAPHYLTYGPGQQS